MDPNSPEVWFKNLPIITRSLLVVMFSSTCMVTLGLLDPHVLILDWHLVTKKYHLWRLLSSTLFLGGFSFGFVMQLYFLTNFGARLESHARFSRSPGDYLYFVFLLTIIVSVMSLLVAWPRGYALTGPSVIFAIIYYWSRVEPEAPLSVWGFQVKGYQLPFALIFLSLLMGGDVWKDIVGLAAGHVYYFLKDIVPLEYRVDSFRTPRFFSKLVEKATNTRPTAPAPAGRDPAWGHGQRLGG